MPWLYRSLRTLTTITTDFLITCLFPPPFTFSSRKAFFVYIIARILSKILQSTKCPHTFFIIVSQIIHQLSASTFLKFLNIRASRTTSKLEDRLLPAFRSQVTTSRLCFNVIGHQANWTNKSVQIDIRRLSVFSHYVNVQY
jgi:hypothetical protein